MTPSKKIKEKYEAKRNQTWPSLLDKDGNNDSRILWERKRKVGFVNIPRTMPIILNILDYLSTKEGGKPLSATYLALWCRDYGTAYIEIQDAEALSLEAGFSGTRSTSTLYSRIKLLDKDGTNGLGFIRTYKGTSTKYKSILMLNPMLIIVLHHIDGKLPKQYFNDLYNRCADVGDKDLETIYSYLKVESNAKVYRKFLEEL